MSQEPIREESIETEDIYTESETKKNEETKKAEKATNQEKTIKHEQKQPIEEAAGNQTELNWQQNDTSPSQV